MTIEGKVLGKSSDVWLHRAIQDRIEDCHLEAIETRNYPEKGEIVREYRVHGKYVSIKHIAAKAGYFSPLKDAVEIREEQPAPAKFIMCVENYLRVYPKFDDARPHKSPLTITEQLEVLICEKNQDLVTALAVRYPGTGNDRIELLLVDARDDFMRWADLQPYTNATGQETEGWQIEQSTNGWQWFYREKGAKFFESGYYSEMWMAKRGMATVTAHDLHQNIWGTEPWLAAPAPINQDKLQQTLNEYRDFLTERRKQGGVNYYNHAHHELHRIIRVLASGSISEEFLDTLSTGMMCVKEMDTFDPPFTDVWYNLADELSTAAERT